MPRRSTRFLLTAALCLGVVAPAWGGFEDGLRAYKRRDYATAFREFLPLASQGNADAQTYVGFMYFYGSVRLAGGPSEDFDAAVKWFRRAAEQGHPDAESFLGGLYQHGDLGVPKDYDEALQWFRRAAEQGDPDAEFSLSGMYEQGEGVPQDQGEADKWLRRAAEHGSVIAQVWLGRLYESAYLHEDGKFAGEAAKWYRRAAEQQQEEARQPELPGTPRPEIPPTAVRRPAQKPVEDLLPLFARLREKLQQQIERMQASLFAPTLVSEAQTSLGRMYARGRGVPQDYGEAMKWFRRATEGQAPNPLAQSELGELYYYGRGVTQNYAVALRWYLRAAERGLVSAQVLAGKMYERGSGITPDYVLAYFWYSVAGREEEARRLRDEPGRRLTPVQLAEAEQLARRWRPLPRQHPQWSPPTLRRYVTVQETLPHAQQVPAFEAAGTGFMVSKGGHVLTAHHVVDGCEEVRAGPHVGDRRATPVVARDPKNDLALLKLSSPTPSAASFREGRGIRPGDAVVVVGFPLRGLLSSAPSLTTGVVSALAGPRDDTRLLQITAPVQPGNSGGPLLDQSGNVVGVVVSKLDALKVAEAIGDIPQNVNFAIHANVARTFLEANGVTYEMAPSTKALETADIGERAKSFAVVVECWNRASEVTRGRE